MRRRSFIGMLAAAAIAPFNTIKSAMTPAVAPLKISGYTYSVFERLLEIDFPLGRHFFKITAVGDGMFEYEQVPFEEQKVGERYCTLDVKEDEEDTKSYEFGSRYTVISPAVDGKFPIEFDRWKSSITGFR